MAPGFWEYLAMLVPGPKPGLNGGPRGKRIKFEIKKFVIFPEERKVFMRTRLKKGGKFEFPFFVCLDPRLLTRPPKRGLTRFSDGGEGRPGRGNAFPRVKGVNGG